MLLFVYKILKTFFKKEKFFEEMNVGQSSEERAGS